MLATSRLVTLLTVLSALTCASASAQSWSNWERENAVAQYRSFLVIKQPGEGFCYAKQSYNNNTSKMELIFKGESPAIVTPYYRGIDGPVRYWVDDGPKRTVKNSEISNANSFNLAAEVVSEMKAGRTLFVQVNPSGSPEVTQEFSLLGFTSAARKISQPECRPSNGDAQSSDLEVQLSRDSGGGLVVSGRTTLPDGMQLMITLSKDDSGYRAQDKVRVRSGSYKSTAFTDRGDSLPSGKYRVSFSSPSISLQPSQVKEELGSSGEAIPQAIRKKRFGSYSVDHTVTRDVE